MAEVVNEMPPPRRAGRPGKYPWDLWFDGQVHRLVQSVPTGDVDDDGEAVMTDGDFEQSGERMRKYARNAGSRRKPPISLRSRVTTVVDDAGRKVDVIYIQALPMVAGRGRRTDTGAAVPENSGPVGVAVEDVPGHLRVVPDPNKPVTQAELEAELAGEPKPPWPGHPMEGQLELPLDGPTDSTEGDDSPGDGTSDDENGDSSDDDEWEQVGPSEDPDDPFAGMSEDEIAAELGEGGG